MALTRDENESWGSSNGKRNASQRHFHHRTGKTGPRFSVMDNTSVESKKNHPKVPKIND